MSNNSKPELIATINDRVRALQVQTDLFDEAAAERLGINGTDHRVLDTLDRLGPTTPSRLAEVNHLSRPAMTTALDRLERAGYARRTADPDDRRRVLVETTPLARKRAGAIYAPFAETGARVLSRYSTAELAVIADFLDRARELNEAQLARLLGER